MELTAVLTQRHCAQANSKHLEVAVRFVQGRHEATGSIPTSEKFDAWARVVDARDSCRSWQGSMDQVRPDDWPPAYALVLLITGVLAATAGKPLICAGTQDSRPHEAHARNA